MLLNLFVLLGTPLLVLVSICMVLLILMQRPNPTAGLGSSLGGGAAESAFGSEANTVLMRTTVWFASLFFLLALGLSLTHIAKKASGPSSQATLPAIQATEALPALSVPAEEVLASESES